MERGAVGVRDAHGRRAGRQQLGGQRPPLASGHAVEPQRKPGLGEPLPNAEQHLVLPKHDDGPGPRQVPPVAVVIERHVRHPARRPRRPPPAALRDRHAVARLRQPLRHAEHARLGPPQRPVVQRPRLVGRRAHGVDKEDAAGHGTGGAVS